MELSYGIHAAVIGGDQRQLVVAQAISGMFDKVKVYGHSENSVTAPLEYSSHLNEALEAVKLVLLPIGGMNGTGIIRSYKDEPGIVFGDQLSNLPKGTIIVTGSFTKEWLQRADSYGIKVLQYADDDEIAILNSIPTAEGTVQIAMQELPVTIHGSTVLVVGFGRVGVTVARIFKALGARVIVSARRQALLARALEMSCETVYHVSLSEVVGTADLIVNSVPSMVLTRELLCELKPGCLIIDLASAPGGTDFEEARKLNIKAILAPGLPGIVAPKTAGAILASSIPRLIADFLKNGGGA